MRRDLKNITVWPVSYIDFLTLANYDRYHLFSISLLQNSSQNNTYAMAIIVYN